MIRAILEDVFELTVLAIFLALIFTLAVAFGA